MLYSEKCVLENEFVAFLYMENGSSKAKTYHWSNMFILILV